MAEYLLTIPSETHKYVVSFDRSKIEGNRLPINVQPIVFLTYGKIQNLTFLLPDSDVMVSGTNSLIILMQDNAQIIENIGKSVPKSQVERIDLRPGTESAFTVIRIP